MSLTGARASSRKLELAMSLEVFCRFENGYYAEYCIAKCLRLVSQVFLKKNPHDFKSNAGIGD